MSITLIEYYLWIKSAHIISVICWMVGLFYLPRLFVYHVESSKIKSDQYNTFLTMEINLLRYIMRPAMVSSWLFGILLIHSIGFENFGFLWLQLKSVLVLLLTTYHFFLLHCLKSLSQNYSRFSSKFYRVINEVPTLLLIAIIFVIVFKPL